MQFYIIWKHSSTNSIPVLSISQVTTLIFQSQYYYKQTAEEKRHFKQLIVDNIKIKNVHVCGI